ncbi:hypothetical protein PsorP6_015277 [Peronosclerospora sorghi]|uniref:Uncharacterized protein n=1 Tax=Peronosclerospora sorghi TaxID=230839 RepID=A0ACC0VST8_9STRA|nr:hypothetical protein PsorP6_015277 [Peronosclerospora sorghi]
MRPYQLCRAPRQHLQRAPAVVLCGHDVLLCLRVSTVQCSQYTLEHHHLVLGARNAAIDTRVKQRAVRTRRALATTHLGNTHVI